jgi:hypothetical protein
MIDDMRQLADWSHMPFRVEDVLFFCHPKGETPTGAKRWKIAYLGNDGLVRHLNTRLDTEAVECSPSAWLDQRGWHVSFVAGGVPSDPLFHLYQMNGCCLMKLGTPQIVRTARAGFVYRDRIAWGNPLETVYIEDAAERTTLTIDGASILRVSYQADAPDNILITASLPPEHRYVTLEYNLRTGLQHEIECDGEPAYKCSIFGDSTWFAYRGSAGFEERRVLKAKIVRRIPTHVINRTSTAAEGSTNE